MRRLFLIGILGLFGCGTEAPPPAPGSFAFAAMGDAPYTRRDERRFEQLIDQLNAEDLAWVLHVGDILDSSCSDANLQARFETLQQIRHPLLYTPGDNEWTDCHERSGGGYAPLERLAKLREIFFANPTQSTGGRTLALVSQSRDSTYSEFVENARWVYANIVFTTIHIVGSDNAEEEFGARTAADDSAVVHRTAAATAWLREGFATARDASARAVVIAIHGDPGLERRPGARRRLPFEAFLQVLEEEVERFVRPVLFVHGDTHVHRIDRPLIRRTTGQRLENFTRLEVFGGSSDVGWVRVVVDTLGPELFRFEPNRIRGFLFR